MAMYNLCTTCAQTVHRFGVITALAVLGACAAPQVEDALLLRNPTVPIGAISRFDIERFDGNWRVFGTAEGDWALTGFSVDAKEQVWRERRIVPVAGDINEEIEIVGTFVLEGPGRLTVTTQNAPPRDIWVVWIDPDHNTAGLGTPDGRFGFTVLREGTYRSDQVAAAEDVLDFNGYRTEEWAIRID